MQVSADIIDFKKLSQYSSSEIINHVFEDDDLSDSLFVFSGYDLEGGWGDSYHVYSIFVDSCTELMKDIEILNQLKKGYSRIFLTGLLYDDLSLKDFPEEGYVSSISNEHCAQISEALDSASTQSLIRKAISTKDNLDEIDTGLYLDQWRNLFLKATEMKLGILIHMG
ncbi:MAG: hypothetical protein ACMZ7B_13260 [Balneola sp.]